MDFRYPDLKTYFGHSIYKLQNLGIEIEFQKGNSLEKNKF